MKFLDQQINPPASWEKFEELCRALFAAIWSDPLTQRHGRNGQAQHGVDIHGARPERPNDTLSAVGFSKYQIVRLEDIVRRHGLAPIGYIPSAEAEANYYRQLANQTAAAEA